MKLSRNLIIAGLSITSVPMLLLGGQGCSSSSGNPQTVEDSGTPKKDTGTPTTDGGTPAKDSGTGKDTGTKKDTGTTGSDKTDAGQPPTMMGAPTTSTTKHNLAMHNLYLGDTEPDAPTFSMPASGATPPWANFGYNIDGLITTAASTDVCTPNQPSDTAQVDGTNGIDNAFGSVIVQDLSSFGVGSQSLSGDVAAGKFTLLVDTVGLTATQPQTATKLGGSLFAGSTYDGTPPLTGSSFSIGDDWPVNSSLLVSPTDITMGSKVVFGNSYVTNGTWVSGEQTGAMAQPIILALSLAGYSLNLTIHDAVITMPLTVDGSGQFHAKTGIVSGVLSYAELLTALNTVLAQATLCSDQQIAVELIQGAQDLIIGSDGTVSNVAGTACNAISIGLAFDADEIAQPDMIAPGTDAGSGGAKTCGDAG